MDNKELHKFIEAFNIGEVETSKYQQALKMKLLSSKKHKQSVFSKIQNFFINSLYITMNKKLIGFGSFAVIAMLAFSITTFNAPSASAKELVEKSIVTISKMSSNELLVIQKMLGSDPVVSLKEAQKAKDLKEITKKEFIEMFDNNKGSIGIAFKLPDDKSVDKNLEPGTIKSIDMKETPNDNSINNSKSNYIDIVSKYLRYTDSNGKLTGLGLDKNGLPILKQIILNEDETKNLN